MIDFVFVEHKSTSQKLCLLGGILAPYGEVHTSSINLVGKIYDTENRTMNGGEFYMREFIHVDDLKAKVLQETGKDVREMRSCDLLLWAIKSVPRALLVKISNFNPERGRKFTAFGHQYDICLLVDTAKDELEERREQHEK